MDEKFLIDTNIVIYYLEGKIPEKHFDKVSQIFEKSFNISTITKVEVLGWHKITQQEKTRIENFLKPVVVYYIDNIVENKAIEIKQESKIPIPDALIGATAIVNNFTIVTRNELDFQKINGLKIYNPFKEIDNNN